MAVQVPRTLCQAQTYRVLHFLDATDGFAYGRLLVSGNTLYGTTSGQGEIFTLATDGTGFTRFQFPGFSSDGGLVESGPILYGTVQGLNGAVVSVNTDGTGFKVLKAFNLADGADPLSELVLVGTTLYGTTYLGGPTNYLSPYGCGTVFKVNTDGTGFSSLWAFSGSDGLKQPRSALVVSGASLFGTAAGDGFHGGAIFRINQDGSGCTVLRTLSMPLDGASPASLLLCGTTLYGTCGAGGAFNRGTLFRLETNGTGFAVLKNFSGADGSAPVGGLVQVDGTLYGVTGSGGYGFAPGGMSEGYGTIFQIETNGGGYFVLKEFAPPDGATPGAPLAASGHTLYGSTLFGGISNYGTIFSFNLPLAPWFISSPSDQVVAAGQDGSFTVTAAGSRPLYYQWVFNGTNLLRAATNSILQLSSVSFSNAGSYAAVVTNVYGSATSSPARLRVIFSSTVTNCSEADLRAAMAAGGVVRVECDGTFPLSSAIDVAQDTVLDATGHTVVLSGSKMTQLFHVRTNTTFTLSSLTLGNGRST
ncbi:MAG TPA: choice-of-anchor tandem repeat GloVer-containing protein, partial [Verrucomicrobiae bacterium]